MNRFEGEMDSADRHLDTEDVQLLESKVEEVSERKKIYSRIKC